MRLAPFALASLVALVLAAPASAQDLSASPTYGSIDLEAGFMPDPNSTEVTSGGKIQVDVPGCSYGYISSAADLELDYSTSGGTDLYVYVIGEGDTTLLINLPDGSWICDDDTFEDGDPILTIQDAEAGVYDIWVGSYSADAHDATLFISEIDPVEALSATEPDWELAPTYGSVELDEGFMPDPHTVDVDAGGHIDLNVTSECSYGYVAEAPDFDLTYESDGGSNLYIYVESKDDTTLLINDPSGNWVCNDDGFEGTNPLVVIENAQSGLYDIWIGTFSGDGITPSKLHISELDPRN